MCDFILIIYKDNGSVKVFEMYLIWWVMIELVKFEEIFIILVWFNGIFL